MGAVPDGKIHKFFRGGEIVTLGRRREKKGTKGLTEVPPLAVSREKRNETTWGGKTLRECKKKKRGDSS